jgi:hypothetical protein
MTIERCLHCNRIWVHNCGPRERFGTITRVCADCIATHIPVAGKWL